jgi:hypothetical protein
MERNPALRRFGRFGEYATDGLINPPDAFDPHLDLHRPLASGAGRTAEAA